MPITNLKLNEYEARQLGELAKQLDSIPPCEFADVCVTLNVVNFTLTDLDTDKNRTFKATNVDGIWVFTETTR